MKQFNPEEDLFDMNTFNGRFSHFSKLFNPLFNKK